MTAGLSLLNEARNQLKELPTTTARGLISEKRAENACLVLEAIMLSSLKRCRNIGAFYRKDCFEPSAQNEPTIIGIRMIRGKDDLEVIEGPREAQSLI
jgi:aspartate oxidase